MRHEVLHGILRKVARQFVVQLPRERLVVRHDQRGKVQPLDDVRHGEGLARPRHAKQHAPFLATLNLLDQLLDGFRLIPGRRVF